MGMKKLLQGWLFNFSPLMKKSVVLNVLRGGTVAVLSLFAAGAMGTVAFAQVAQIAPIVTLSPIADQTVIAGQTVTFTASATDSDPAGVVTYSLMAGSDFVATIDPVSGIFSWNTAGLTTGIGGYGFGVTATGSTGGSSSQWFYINVVPTGTLFLSTTPNPDGTLSGTITDATIASTTSGGFPVVSYIPAGTVVTGPSTWDGTVYPPTDNLSAAIQVASTGTSTTTFGYFGTATVLAVIGTTTVATTVSAVPVSSVEIGFGSTPLAFTNHAVRIVFAGKAGQAIGFTHDWSNFTPITDVCSADSQAVGDALLATPGADCYIDVSSDLVVWTTHFSSYTGTSGLPISLVPTVGSLVVSKDTIGGDGMFSFTSSDGSIFSITTANGTGSYIITDLAPGTYTVTEPTQPKGWKQTGTDCSAVVVTAGNIASCTITDTKNGEREDRADNCKNGDWKTFINPQFKNQGQCVSYIQTNEKADTSVGNLPPNGSPNAKVKIIEYGNYYDPFSRMFFQNIEQQLRTKYIETGKVVMYWKDLVFPDFPGLLGDTSAANVARCANEQGKFWQYHDLLLTPPMGDPMEPLDFKSFGEQLGLNMTRFSRCLDAKRYQPLIEASSQKAVREGVNAVPTFFINGRPIIGAQPFDEFKRIIEEELAKQPKQHEYESFRETK
jgi:protein-disulfide isomerase